MADMQTGEVIENAFEWLTALSAQNKTAETLERSAPGLQILACLAWCDGHLTDEERRVMLNYVDTKALSLDLRWDVIEIFVNLIQPSMVSYDKALRRLTFLTDVKKHLIITAAKNLVLADGVLASEEAELMALLKAYF